MVTYGAATLPGRLPIAEKILSASPHPASREVRAAVSNSLAGVKDIRAIPVLARLLVNPDVLTRRAAAIALGNTRSNHAVPALVKALNDPDRDVRYNVVIAFEKIERQSDSAMAPEYFVKEETNMIAHWRKRAQQLAPKTPEQPD